MMEGPRWVAPRKIRPHPTGCGGQKRTRSNHDSRLIPLKLDAATRGGCVQVCPSPQSPQKRPAYRFDHSHGSDRYWDHQRSPSNMNDLTLPSFCYPHFDGFVTQSPASQCHRGFTARPQPPSARWSAQAPPRTGGEARGSGPAPVCGWGDLSVALARDRPRVARRALPLMHRAGAHAMCDVRSSRHSTGRAHGIISVTSSSTHTADNFYCIQKSNRGC